jgi:para-nitrobenzyl esterase
MGETVVELRQGKLTGLAFPGHMEYRGIPFAAAPVGPLRWKRPQPHPGWEGVLRAEQFAAPCLQPGNLPDTFYGKEFYQDTSWQQAMREDCLYLNIWTPTEPAPAGGYPVACWIHGGAFNNGYGHEIEFDGAGFCRRGVVLVTIQYRLNVFGFFDHPWLAEEDPQGLSGNYGLYDQMAALTWIRDNIGAFGGNPERVTIFGQSAGARSVQLLTESPLAEGLFSQAILQSGAGLNRSRRPMRVTHSLKNGQAFVQALGIKSLSALRAMPGPALMEAWLDHVGANPEAGCGIHWDGHLIGTGMPEPDHEQHIPHIHPGAILVGAMADEFALISRGTPMLSRMWPDTLGWVEDACVARGIPVHVYHFERKLPGDEAGAFHSGELWYVFETLTHSWRPFEPVDYRISEQVAAYWTNFIRTGDPNGRGLPEWEPYRPDAGRVLRINETIGMGQVPD